DRGAARDLSAAGGRRVRGAVGFRDRAARLDMPAPPQQPPIVTSIQQEVAAPSPEAAPGAAEAKAMLGSESFKVTANRAVAPTEVVARYAPGTLLQAGPGIPAWNYGAHPFGWSGPVESDQTVRFVVLGPVAVAVWRIAGVALLALLFIALARASFGPRPALGQFLARGSAAAALLLS